MTAAKSAPGQGPKLTVVEGAQAGSPGQRLARARTQRNLSLEDVARQLNLSVSMVRAIESDNFKSLPGRAFVRGYLRNYCKLVGLPSDELVKAFEVLFGGGEDVVLSPPDVRRPSRWMAPVIRGAGYLLLVAVVLGLGSLVYENFGLLMDKTRQLTASFGGEAQPEPVSDTPEETVATGDDSSDNTVKLSIPLHPVESATATDAPAAGAPATAETPAVAPVSTSTPPAPTPVVPPQSSLGDENAAPVVAANDVPTSEPTSALRESAEDASGIHEGAASVSLNFSGTSWVRVRDANDKTLFDGVKSAGAALQLQGLAPFKIRLGNAPAVTVALNGKPYDFDFSSRSNVAQFTLGDD